MKIITTVGVCILLGACGYNPKPDVALEPRPAVASNVLEEVLSTTYPNHFVACRGYESERVNAIVEAAVGSGKDVVLYFHGGLSSQEYVVNELGKKLMKSVFEDENYVESVYPIFFNYDADPIENWLEFVNNLDSVVQNKLYQLLVDRLKREIGVADFVAKSASEKRDGYRLRAAGLLESYRGIAGVQADALTLKHVEDRHKDYIEILRAKKLPSDYVRQDAALSDPLSEIAGQLETLDQNYRSSKGEQVQDAKLLPDNRAALLILRILARMALGSDHGFVATIQEEVLDALGVSKLGAKHWNIVKRHARECFAEQSNGWAIVKALADKKVRIHTLSHSAGSIPVSILIKYLGESDHKEVLQNVVMLAPAVSNQVFRELVISNQDVFEQLTIYVLHQEYELDDDVLSPWLYDSSLLYAVSSLGEEESLTLDQMLLVEQHLTPGKSPYRYDLYLKLSCEDPDAVWDYFRLGDNLVLYPFAMTANKQHAGTHEGTKLPSISPDLVEAYMRKITGVSIAQPSFTDQHIKPVESQWINMK